MKIKKKVVDRIIQQLRRYQPILTEARSRDISESDTVVIVIDMLADVLGYRKFSEITTEYSIRSTFVDLAVKVGPDVRFLIEVKHIGTTLKEQHVKQAIDYGANNGIEWVILTNAGRWQVYKIHFGQPIDKSVVFDIDLFEANPRSSQVVSCFGSLSREGFTPSSMSQVFQQQQAMSRFTLAAVMLSDSVTKVVRRELRRMSPGLKVDSETLRSIVESEVLKREVVESDEARQAIAKLKKLSRAKSSPKRMGTEEPSKPSQSELVVMPSVPPETPTDHRP
jgi:predicted type IV restriction endonuclease